MNYSRFYAPIQKELGTVEMRLQRLLQSDDGFVSQNVAYILNAGGKRLRPALLLTAAKMCDCSGEQAIRMAMVVELIHTATLIHDDVIDGHGFRRGIATINSCCGDAISILTGDYLYSKAFEILAESDDIDIIRCVASTTNRIAKGELLQAQVQGDSSLTEDKYLSIIADKTASLISCACRMGAMLGHGSNGSIDALANYGHNLGMAFQITDDLLDFTGAENVLGKPIGSDIREGKVTLPLIHTLLSADKKDKEWIGNTLKSRVIDTTILKRIRQILEQYKGIEYSLRKAQEYVEACKKEIVLLGKSDVYETLTMIADYSLYRFC
jgi:octaprenyl-diphosphate synthase